MSVGVHDISNFYIEANIVKTVLSNRNYPTLHEINFPDLNPLFRDDTFQSDCILNVLLKVLGMLIFLFLSDAAIDLVLLKLVFRLPSSFPFTNLRPHVPSGYDECNL